MTTPISRRYRRNSIFGDGHRVPLDRERRAVWKARIEMHRRAGRLTDGHAFVALALVRRLGTDGRLDPSHATLADDAGESLSTVQRALRALRAVGLVLWVRRLVRDGWRAAQTSNAYLLTLGESPAIHGKPCDGHRDRGTLKKVFIPMQPSRPDVSDADRQAAQMALATVASRRAGLIQASMLRKGGTVTAGATK